MIPLERILIVEGVPPEHQIALLNAMINRELLKLDSNFKLEITEKGKKTIINDLNK